MPSSRMPRFIKVAIIGGGPSGLTTLKTLIDLSDRFEDVHVEASLFEAEPQLGGTFRYRAYDNAQLVSSKQLTAFSDFRLPLDAPDHMTLPRYVRYLEDYTRHFKLQQRARRFMLDTKVIHVRRTDHRHGHIVTWQTRDGETHADVFTHLSLCSGLHVTPSHPEIPGMPPLQNEQPDASDDIEGVHLPVKSSNVAPNLSVHQQRIVALHSSVYKSPRLYRDKRVMILGTGETGMDMAYEAVKARAKEIVLCTREGFLSFPAVLENFTVLGVTFDRPTPIDTLITNLFETAYVHPWVSTSHLRWFVSDAVIKKVLWVLTGTEAGCSQFVGELPPERLGRAYTFLNKSARAMPYINRNWKNRHWAMEKFARYLDPPTVTDDEPGVDLAPFPSHITPDGQVIFRNNNRKEAKRMQHRNFKPDVIVFATGYTQEFPFLDEKYGHYPTPAEADCRDVFASDDTSVSFIGFTRPGVGAIPPQAEMAAQLWALVIAGKLDPPTSSGHYYLLARPQARIHYGVDYSSYVSQLARDMGSAPSLWELWRQYGVKVLFTYCFSAAFVTHYRLTGPWKDVKAAETVKTEIYETITRRGVGGNLMMGLIPMVFYAYVSAIAYILERLLHFAEWVAPKSCNAVATKLGLASKSARKHQSQHVKFA